MTATYNITINAYSGSIINIGDIAGCLTNCHVSCSYMCSSSSSGSSGSFSPTDIDGLLHWYKSDEGVVSSSGSVSGWSDIIGNVDGYQSLSSHQPQLVNDVVNDIPAIIFSQGSTQNATTNLDALIFPCAVSNPWSVLLTWRLNEPTIGTFDGSGNDAKTYVITAMENPSSASTRFVYLAVGPGEHVTGSTIITGFVSSSVYTELNNAVFGTTIITCDSSMTSLINNDTIITSGSLTPVDLNNIVLGADANNTYNNGARMSVVEMMVFTGSLSTGSVTALTNYANTRYAL